MISLLRMGNSWLKRKKNEQIMDEEDVKERLDQVIHVSIKPTISTNSSSLSGNSYIEEINKGLLGINLVSKRILKVKKLTVH